MKNLLMVCANCCNVSWKSKIGIGVITHNRKKLFRECISGVPEVDALVIVNDGEPYPPSIYPSRVTELIQHRFSCGVGQSKNDAMKRLLDLGCTDIFLIEDDLRIVDPNICETYIRASHRSGIRHFNFAYHGYENKFPNGVPRPPRKTVDYEHNIKIGLHREILGAFQYFTCDVLRECGLMDPLFVNMFEHVDHTMRIIKHGFHPPFWWFADLSESYRHIEDLDPQHKQSTIRNSSVPYRVRMKMSDFYFALKHASFLRNVKDVDEQAVELSLSDIERRLGSRHPSERNETQQED